MADHIAVGYAHVSIAGDEDVLAGLTALHVMAREGEQVMCV
jgi:hypothetical protein